MSSASDVASLLWIEGVDFDQTLYDTNQLSVVRGASLTLLAIGRRAEETLKNVGAKPELIFSGASQALFKLPCDEKTAEGQLATLLAELYKPKQGDAPFHQMQWLGGVAADDNSDRSPRLAQGRARLMQMDGTAPRRAVVPETKVCPWSRHLPAEAAMNFTPDRAAKYGVSEGAVLISQSAKARFEFPTTPTPG